MLDYPSKDGNWTWEELELLAKALGYHYNVFYENTPVELKNKSYITSESLRFLLEGDKLYPHVHKTYNHQNGTYNIKVIQKSIELLTQRYISFSILRMARVSFQTYEHTDHAGLEDKFVLRAMQFCRKTIAPLKFRTILRHMGRLIPDRLMFYEFLELLASADDVASVKQELPPKKDAHGTIDNTKLYELCDFLDELCTEEQRYYRYLDQKYEDSRRVIAVEESENDANIWKSNHPQQWAIPPLANQSIRKEMSQKNHVQSEMLKSHLDLSSSEVKKRGCSIPCTCEAKLLSSLIKTDQVDKPVESTETQTSTVKASISVKRLEPIVSKQDLDETARKIESMQWDIATHSRAHKTSLPSRR